MDSFKPLSFLRVFSEGSIHLLSMYERRGRPEPLSCQFCRSKKLRCNRAQPCSNCEVRNITCHFLVPPPRIQREQTTATHSNTTLLARIERLESLVLPDKAPGESHSGRQAALTPRFEDAVLSSTHRKGDTDLQLLENIGTREDSLLSSLSNDLAFTISSTREILESREHPQYAISVVDQSLLGKTVIAFPTYETAVLLFDCFKANVDHMCRILHIPTVQSLMTTFYVRIIQKESILPSQAALLLSLFALSAFFYPGVDPSGLAPAKNDTVYLSKFWSREALDVLDHSRRNTSGTLEDIQALILMSYVTYHLDGFSARYRQISALATSIARDIGLHRLDADDYTPTNGDISIRILIDREVKRRVYWHLVAEDWLHSTMSGPQEGTYSIHLNHIHVRLPKESDDENVVPGEDNGLVASPHPTGLSFLLARIRLAHLCREYTDTIPLETSKLMKIPYEHIIALDKKLENFLTDLPVFFRLDGKSRQKSKPLEIVYPNIPIMRYCILTAAHSRRCRLHQKFLLRHSYDPRYSFSRQACLDSARAVMRLYEEPKAVKKCPSMETARMAMAVHYTHLALVVMVMDLCFNKGEADHEERKTEVKTALQMLGGATAISPLLNRSLESVVEVLHRYQIYIPGPQDLTPHSVSATVQQTGQDFTTTPDNAELQFPQLGLDNTESEFAIDPSIDEFWQTANQTEMNLDSATWDNLFSALDSRPF
ncbi:hypothetical protein F5Y19DRAFT_484325 [Xylariaceae sp. FL1651]|nr:hypothetical protein F5Y19DRAFT_484325 [Xylariaceae sp. FL1651]